MAWVPKGSTQTKTRMMFTQKEQHSWRRKEGPSDNIQIWGLHWIIKIIGCYIIHLPHKCHVCLCLEIHPIICLVSPHILILVLECHMGLYIMEGYHQIVVHIDYLKKPKYLIPRDGFNYWLYISLYTLFRLYMFLWMNSLWMIIYIIFDNIYGPMNVFDYHPKVLSFLIRDYLVALMLRGKGVIKMGNFPLWILYFVESSWKSSQDIGSVLFHLVMLFREVQVF